MKSIPVTISGRYVAHTAKKWDGFTADDGKTVEPGSSLIVHVVSDSGVLFNVKASNFVREVDALTFGAAVKIEAEAKPYRQEFVFTALSLNAGVKAA